MEKLKNFGKLIPGFLIALVIAAVAKLAETGIEKTIHTHVIGASVIALFIGMIINAIKKPNDLIKGGLKFTSKKILKFAIILLGASLNITTVLSIGRMSLTVMVFTLLTCFGGGYFIGKALGINWKLSNLISAGTGICGGSAIAAIAPVIDADDSDVAYAMSSTFLFDMAMIVLFPIMGKAMHLTDMAYGLWSGTAVNDTSSVVAAGYAFSEAAGNFATMVKLTRTLSIIPTVIVFALIAARLERKKLAAEGMNGDGVKAKFNITKVIPWFILGFLALTGVNSVLSYIVSKEGVSPETVTAITSVTTFFSTNLKDISKFLMVTALAAIGLNTSFKDMKKSGIKPMVHGFIISALVVIVAIGVEFMMYKFGSFELFI